MIEGAKGIQEVKKGPDFTRYLDKGVQETSKSAARAVSSNAKP